MAVHAIGVARISRARFKETAPGVVRATARGVKRTLIVCCGALGLTFLGSTCDLKADECNEGQNYCTADNAVVICQRPVPEAHREIERRDCGPTAMCTIDAQDQPFCARKPLAPCVQPQARTCDGNLQATCVATKSAGNVWSDDDCAPGKCVTTDGGAYCR
jgi:hypothetical protein